METIGLDLHKRESQLSIQAEDGTITERRIATSRERFTAVLGTRPRARILLEASTESEWVARHLEALGHEVIVADPNYAPMYATSSRRVKTDKRDARTLMEACGQGTYRRAHRLSEPRRHLRAELLVRDALVRTRTRYVALIKALGRRDGLRVPSSTAERVGELVRALEMPAPLAGELEPLLTVLAPLNASIGAADQRLSVQAETDPVVALLMTAPGVGPVTASALVATIDDISRFHSAHQCEAYLGLVPGERSSGEQRRTLGILRGQNPPGGLGGYPGELLHRAILFGNLAVELGHQRKQLIDLLPDHCGQHHGLQPGPTAAAQQLGVRDTETARGPPLRSALRVNQLLTQVSAVGLS